MVASEAGAPTPWNLVDSRSGWMVATCQPLWGRKAARSSGTRQPPRTQPRSDGRRPSPGRSPAPSPPRQRRGPTGPARRREERCRRSRSPHRAPFLRICLRTPSARRLAAARRCPTVLGRRGTTRPRAAPSAVRDPSAADHRWDHQPGCLIARTSSSLSSHWSRQRRRRTRSTRLDH